ncbi:hypothetical protein [Massilia sp. HP4]|uniref:hypothetical protein n=1 Tax=Massilia sp. HP4 TaxID=2562316 RepID=UPI0010C0DCF2|nr:hypothetical protein [Massilia sp. HP4]
MASLYELLNTLRPRRAFFSSYTFSADWFEAVVYPLLKHQECEQVTVMLDAREARSSVDNSTSHLGGSRYRIIGTTPRGSGPGIFHPKIAYLECEHQDVLVVSSANLTTLGQCQAFEVIDAVWAGDAPAVFEQAADFFGALPHRLAMLQSGDLKVLEGLAGRARAQAATFASHMSVPPSVWLVSTAQQSAASQFIALAAQYLPAPATLTVLSPFHDADLAATVQLAGAIGAVEPLCALARSNGRLVAPFPSPSNGMRRMPVYVEVQNQGRPLHAKWFELAGSDGRTLVMTGSVNATWRSLWTTNNIEVALVRLRQPGESTGWLPVHEEPCYVPCEFPAPETGPDALLFVASIGRDNVLDVRMSATLPGPVTALELYCAGRSWPLSDDVVTDGDRILCVLDRRFRDELPEAALWLDVTVDGIVGRSWVNIERSLGLKPSQLDLFKSIARVESDICDEEDMFQLFSAGHALLTGSRLDKKGLPGKAVRRPEGVNDISYVTEAQWMAGLDAGDDAGRSTVDAAVRLFQAIGTLLELGDADIAERLGAGTGSAPAAADDETDDDEQPADADDGRGDGGGRPARGHAPPGASRLAGLAQARRTLQAAIDLRLKRPMPDAVAVLLVPQKLRNHLRSGLPEQLSDVDFGHCGPNPAYDPVLDVYLHGILQSLHSLTLTPAAAAEILPVALGAACVAGLCLQRRGLTVDHARFRLALDSLARRQIASEEYEQFLHKTWREGRLPRMLRFDVADLQSQAIRIATAPAPMTKIASLIERALDDAAPLDAAASPLDRSIASALRRRRAPRWKLYAVIAADELPRRVSCPQCHAPLDTDQIRSLHNDRMILCKASCGRPIIFKQGASAGQALPHESQALTRDLRPATTSRETV